MSSDLSKSKLASKDKDQLTQIATAMGGKPGSRARKAEIIDMILELAGADGDDGAGAATSAPKTAAAYSADPMADARAEAARQGGSGTRGRSATATVEAPTPDTGASEGHEGADARTAGDEPAASGDSRAAAEADSSESRDQQGRNGGDEREHAETGNRRRRRRGRNRDRPEQNDDWAGEPVDVEGILDLRDDGYGFLRVKGYLPTKEDVYVSVKQVRQFGLRRGDRLKGAGRPANRSEKNPAMVRIDAVNGSDPEEALDRPVFEDLVAVLPTERIILEREDDPTNTAARVIDLVAPIGKGTRGLVLAPPRAGRTTLLKDIARAIETNSPEVELVVLLVDERPEEATDMERLLVSGHVVSSTFDRPPEEHGAVAELTIECAKRMVELGRDVVLIFDGLTRLARAANAAGPGNNRVSAGEIDASALYPPKRLFGAARNVDHGGSLTILATINVETGSGIDELVFDALQGTANMELLLSGAAARQGIHPAIDVVASSTSYEEQLLEVAERDQLLALRRALAGIAEAEGSEIAALERLLDQIGRTETNDQLLDKGLD